MPTKGSIVASESDRSVMGAPLGQAHSDQHQWPPYLWPPDALTSAVFEPRRIRAGPPTYTATAAARCAMLDHSISDFETLLKSGVKCRLHAVCMYYLNIQLIVRVSIQFQIRRGRAEYAEYIYSTTRHADAPF